MKQLFYTILIIFTLLPLKILAQADISMATHWYNRANYNPAFIARTDYAYFFSNARYQWVGVEGAPKVLNVQASEYLYKYHSAVGFSFVSDKIGAVQALNPMLTYAYRISDDYNWSLAMGLSGGVFSRTTDGSLFEADAIDDPSINYTAEKIIRPDANAGLEFQNAKFIFGLSSTHLFSIAKPDDIFLNTNHRYVYAIYKNNKSKLFYYKIGTQVVNRRNLTVIEGNIFVRFKHSTGLMSGAREIFDLGMTVRSSRQITFLLGLLITPDLRIGYAYDQSFIDGYYPNSTHEVLLEYRIPNKLASSRTQCRNKGFWYH